MADRKACATERPVPAASGLLVHNLIHDRAQRHPDSEAVLSWDCTLSYAELDVLSSGLAALLLENDVGPEVIVPLLFEKSGWTLVSMLAVMKAGGAFMPLDTSQPENRLRSIIQQTGAKVALTSGSCYRLCSSLVETSIAVARDSIRDPRRPSTKQPRQWQTEPQNAAYVMATSGSTGTPKLVITEHSQLSSFVAYLTQPLGFDNNTRAFQFASYAFDPIIGDIFLTLCAGGTVCVPSEEERKNDLVGAMQRMRVNLAKFTPSLVSSLAESLTPETVPTLRTLVFGGETASPALVQAWADRVALKLIYGSTECTISCVVDAAGKRVILPGEIGCPVGSRAWVVRPHDSGELVEDGEAGELVLEGPLVSRGYLNDKAQTERKYISTTRWSSTGNRLFRTGDLVRQLADGRLIYVGRVDNQVKIRGQRLELEEVEKHVQNALATMTGLSVKSVLVDFSAPMGSAAKQLVGILSIKTDSPFGSLLLDGLDTSVIVTPETRRKFAPVLTELESIMKSMVPAYMVPTLWIHINDMPYTLSRKRDRQRLRKAIGSLQASTLASFHYEAGETTGRTETSNIGSAGEKLLQEWWSKILGQELDTICPGDNFFHLGGDSLSVLRLVSMARQTGRYRLNVDDVFQHPVLGDLASKMTTIEMINPDLIHPFALLEPSNLKFTTQEAAQQCGLDVEDIADILPLYSMQHHYITGYPEVARRIEGPWDWQQQIVFLLPDGLDIPQFRSVWRDLIMRHSQLRTRAVKCCDGLFQVVVRPDHISIWQETADLDAYIRQDRESIMTFGDPLLRLAIVSSDQRSFFVLTMQHLIYDAFSRELLFNELEAGYLHHNIQRVPPPNINQFVSYVNTKADKRAALKFWTSYLDGATTTPLLSKPVGGQAVGEIKVHSWTVSRPEPAATSKYKLATTIEVSAALAIAHMQHASEQDGPTDVVFYSDRAGRNLPVEGISDLVAPTTLFLPLRVNIDQRQSVHDLLSSHQAAAKAMITHEHMNWTELREMEHLKDVLKHSVNININPYTTLSRLGRGIGMEVVDEHEKCDDPFGINVSVGGDEMEWVLYFDEAFISTDLVQKLAVRLQRVFGLINLGVDEESNTSVRELLTMVDQRVGISASTWG